MALFRNRSVLCLTVVTLSLVFLLPGRAFAQVWRIEVVDSLCGAWFNSLALDSNGYPAISYFESLNEDLKFAYWNGSSWDIEIVDWEGDVGRQTSLALDSNGYPAISYADRFDDLNEGDLKFARWNGSSWDIETVDSIGDIRWTELGTSLSLDSNGYPAISYYDSWDHDLKFARWNGSSWDIEVVDSDTYVGPCSSLELDSNGYPAISYQDWWTTNENLKFARWNGSSWDIEVVDSDGDLGYSNSLALDSNGYPAISYSDATNRDLKFARWNGSSWDIEVVDSGTVGSWNSLALDSNGYPAISYSGETNDDLKFARWNGSSWDIEVVEADGNNAGHSSLELDSNGYPAISYSDRTNFAMKFALYEGLRATVYRGCVDTSAAGDWRSVRLPLTGNNDDEAPPFPIVTDIPGEVFDDNFPCQEEFADLLLYRILIGGTAPAGNILRAEKVPTGVKLSF